MPTEPEISEETSSEKNAEIPDEEKPEISEKNTTSEEPEKSTTEEPEKSATENAAPDKKKDREYKKRSENHEDLHKVIVTNIKSGTSVEELRDWLMEKVPELSTEDFIDAADIKIQQRQRNGFAFLTLKDTLTVDKCIAELYKLDDRERKLRENTIHVKRTVPKQMLQKNGNHHRARTKKMFVANLPRSMTVEELEAELRKIIDPLCKDKVLGFAESYQIIVMKDRKTKERTSEARGIAFVHLTNEHLADKLGILFGYGGVEIGGRKIDIKKDCGNYPTVVNGYQQQQDASYQGNYQPPQGYGWYFDGYGGYYGYDQNAYYPGYNQEGWQQVYSPGQQQVH